MIATIFDFNGVLVDDERVHFDAFLEVLRPLGVTFDWDAYDERYLGFDDVGAFRAMLKDAGLPHDEARIHDLLEQKKPVYQRQIAGGGLKIFDGAADLVRRRAKLGLVGIVSGALRDEIHHALDVLGVKAEIAFIVSAEDTKECKPDPEGYLHGIAELAKLGFHGTKGAVVVEDSLAGVASAKGAGLRCAAVAHSYPAERLRAAGADVVAEKLADLTDAMLDGA